MTVLAEDFDKDPIVLSAYTDSCETFARWAAMDGPELPLDPVDAMQVRLMRWQVDRFGLQSDERMALGVIEEISEGDVADVDYEAIDALGDVLVYAGQLCINTRLAIGPIMQLAALWVPDAAGTLERLLTAAQGILAQTVLKGAQKIRGSDDAKIYGVRLVGSLAVCIMSTHAHACALSGKNLVLADVYRDIGSKVLERARGHEAIPKLVVH